MTAAARSSADRQILCPLLIGRDAEMGQLSALLQETRSGHGRTVLVSGEAGVGKSAAIRDFVQRARGLGIRAFTGECTEIDARRPFGPFVDIARAANRPSSLPVAPPDAAMAGADRYRLHSFFTSLLGDLSRERPVIIVVEDLHWADEASLELFPHLARKLRGAPLLLVGTYRSDELHRRHPLRSVLAELGRGRLAVDIPLRRLSEEEVTEFLREAMHLERPPTPELRHAIFETCEGNPLFMEEVLRALAERGDIEYRQGSWRQTKDVADIAIPDTLRDAVLERFTPLPAETQNVLRYAAVIGQDFDFDLLLRVTGSEDADLVGALRASIDAQLIVESADEGHTDRYSFRHALTRESVLLDLLKRERRRMHTIVGEAIESGAGEDAAGHAEALAYHFDEAGDVERASHYHDLSASEAARNFAYGPEVQHLERVIALAASDNTGTCRIDLRLAEALRRAGDIQRALRAADDAREGYARIGDARGQAAALRTQVAALAELEEHDRALLAGEAAVQILAPLGESDSLADVHAQIARVRMLKSDWSGAIEAGERAISVAQRVGAIEVELDAQVTVGYAMSNLTASIDHGAEGMKRMREAIDLGVARGAIFPTFRGFANLEGAMWEHRFPADLVRGVAAEYIAHAHRFDFRHATVIVVEAEFAMLDADWDLVLRLASESVGEGSYASMVRIMEACVTVGRDGPAVGLALLESRRHYLRGLGRQNRSWQAGLLAQVLGFAAQDRELLGFAEDFADLIGRGDPDPGLDAVAVGAIVAARSVGDDKALHHWIELCLAAPQTIAAPVDLRRAYAQGERHAAGDDTDSALVSIAESIRISDSLHSSLPFPRIALRLRRVELLLLRAKPGDREAAPSEFAELVPYWRKAKASWYLAWLERWATERGLIFPEDAVGAPVPRESDARFQLTAREREVAALVASGLSNKQIGEKLVISERTAEGHVERILSKLGFRSRAQIASWQAGGDLSTPPS